MGKWRATSGEWLIEERSETFLGCGSPILAFEVEGVPHKEDWESVQLGLTRRPVYPPSPRYFLEVRK